MIEVIQHSYQTGHETVPGLGLGVVRAAFIDPPYNIGIKYDGDTTRDKMDPLAYQVWIAGVMFGVNQHLMPGGTAWWLCPAAHMDFVPQLLAKHIGPCLFRIVKRESFAQYQQQTLTEDYRMLFCHQKPSPCGGGLVFNPDSIRVQSERQKLGDKRADPRGRVPGQVWDIRRLQGTAVDRVDWHKAQVAPELCERVVLGFSNPGEIILDSFAGSGIMGQVCRAAGRHYVGVDQSPFYVGKIKERLGIELCQPALSS